jgi:hypothetical protein
MGVGAASAIVVGGLVLGGFALRGGANSDDTVSLAPSPTLSVEPPPVLAFDPANPLGDFPFVREDFRDPYDWDFARFDAPATGEVWHEPTEIPDPRNLLIPTEGWVDEMHYYSVGTRGDSDIVAAYAGSSYLYTFEVAANGQGSLLPCLSAVSWECELIDAWQAVPHPDVAVRADVFYVSLSLPWSYLPEPTYGVGLPSLGSEYTFWEGGPYTASNVRVSPNDWGEFDGVAYAPYATMGSTTILEMTFKSRLPGYRSLNYLVLMPQGMVAVVPSESTSGGDFYQITWDDGFGSEDMGGSAEGSVSPGSPVCTEFGSWMIDEDHDDSLWYPAGHTWTDVTVYLPTADNPLPERVRQLHFDSAPNKGYDNPYAGTDSEGDVDPYPFHTEQEFRDARALWAVERPDGTWLIGMRSIAVADTYECS